MPNVMTPISHSQLASFAKKSALLRAIDPHGKAAFLKQLPQGARLLDVGCGNDSPRVAKALRPDIYYVGLDIGDYYQTNDPTRFADDYVIAEPSAFDGAIAEMANSFDAVISAHNIEHCLDPARVLVAMLKSLKPGGRIFLSFPSSASTTFPSR